MNSKNEHAEFKEVLHIYLGDFYRAIRKSNSYYILGLFKGIVYLLKNMVYAFRWRGKSVIAYEETQQKTWLLCSSLNNYNTLRFLADKLENTIFVTTNTLSFKSDLEKMNKLSFHQNLKQLYAFPNHFLKIFRKQGLFAFKIFDAILEGCGMVKTCTKILKEGQPSAIVYFTKIPYHWHYRRNNQIGWNAEI